MSYSVYGYVKDEDGNGIKDVQVMPYFKKVDSGSDDSMYSTEYYATDKNGYYSYSPEDDNLLGSEGSYKKDSDKFYCMYVLGGGEKIDSLDITHAMFHDHTIVKDDDVEINLTWEPTRAPIMDDHTFPDVDKTQVEYSMDEDSYADTSWKSADYGEDRSQKLLYDNVDIFDGHQVIDTVYSWGEIDDREVANSSSDKFTFTYAGDYTLKITAREKWNTFTEVTKDVRIIYNEPEIDFHWSPVETNDWDGSKIKGQEEITFHNDSSDIDNRTWDEDFWGDEVYTYKWEIEDANQDDSDNTEVVEDAKHPDEPKHKFQREGTYDITLTMYWNDGFDDYEKSITKQIEIYPFTIIPEFHWSEEVIHNRGQEIEFDPYDTTGDTDQISRYDWDIEDWYAAPDDELGLYTFDEDEDSVFDEGSPDNTTKVDNFYDIDDLDKPVLHFHSIDDKNAKVTITYYDGWKDVTNEIEHTITCERYDVTEDFSISDEAPQGRWVEVTMSNTSAEYTQESVDLGYGIDWYIDDWYLECNLDNPEAGEKTDNSDSAVDVAKDEDIVHKWQNTDENNVRMVMRYDDGWQMQEKDITKVVHPIVFDDPEPAMDWDPKVPQGRWVEVTISNTTDYDNDRCRDIDWVANDYYVECNLDNPEEGEKTDNTETWEREAWDFEPTHKWQNTDSNDIEMVYWFDDGYCEKKVELVEQITPIVFEDPDPQIDWTPDVPQGRWVETTVSNGTDYDHDRCRGMDWKLDDFYSECNLDNENPGEKTDNGEEYEREDWDFEIVHKWQNVEENDIWMKYWFDDGYCERSVETTEVITPIVFEDPVPEFSWTPEVPQGRWVDVTVTNDTDYDNDRSRDIDWYIDDYYSKCNLDNEEPGEETDNSEYLERKAWDYEPVHAWQNVEANNIKMDYFFDDGYCERLVTLEQEITPIVFPDPDPTFEWTPEVPQGRDVVVVIKNTTDYDNDRCRDIDWDLEDYYIECNLDNPEPGEKTDNSESWDRKAWDYEPEHAFQSPADHVIEMDYYFDDGYCERLVELDQTITPIVYPDPTPEFSWSPEVPLDREDEVTFTNETDDPDERFRAYDWVIDDHYNKWNPDSSDYGNGEVDNTQVIDNNDDYDLQPTHKFQDQSDENVWMQYRFDDGYCEMKVEIDHTVTKDVYEIEPVIAWDKDTRGKMEVKWKNDGTGDTARELDERWEWNDKTFPAEDDEWTERDDQTVREEQPFTWQYPSRKPFTAIDGAESANPNKLVKLEVRIDTGWRDDTDDHAVGDDNETMGGQVYWPTDVTVEAVPFEVTSSEITFEENVGNNKW